MKKKFILKDGGEYPSWIKNGGNVVSLNKSYCVFWVVWYWARTKYALKIGTK